MQSPNRLQTSTTQSFAIIQVYSPKLKQGGKHYTTFYINYTALFFSSFYPGHAHYVPPFPPLYPGHTNEWQEPVMSTDNTTPLPILLKITSQAFLSILHLWWLKKKKREQDQSTDNKQVTSQAILSCQHSWWLRKRIRLIHWWTNSLNPYFLSCTNDW